MYKLRTKHRLYCSHYLKDHDGKCRNLHGHEYYIILEIHKKELNDINMVYDTHKINLIFNAYVLTDHINLNEFLNVDNPTMEIMAKIFYDDLKEGIPELYSVTVQETPEARVIYIDEEE